jgi:hypothetical protein
MTKPKYPSVTIRVDIEIGGKPRHYLTLVRPGRGRVWPDGSINWRSVARDVREICTEKDRRCEDLVKSIKYKLDRNKPAKSGSSLSGAKGTPENEHTNSRFQISGNRGDRSRRGGAAGDPGRDPPEPDAG